MIRQLRAKNGRAPAIWIAEAGSGVMRMPITPAPGHTDKSAARIVSSIPPSSPRATSAGESLGGMMRMMRSLDSRLMRIEEELRQRPKTAEPTPGAPPVKDATFSGVIQGQMLSDMLQLVSSNQMSGIFVIENDLSSCTLYFDEGRICHAANGAVTGEDAFFAAFAAGSGRYHFKEMKELPPERTVSAGTQYLVLEALRRMDEKQSEES
jgi:hypothetical protein